MGSGLNRVRPALDQLASHGVAPVLFQVIGEPTISLAEEGAALAQREACDLVVGIGGGSALDAGKAIAALRGQRWASAGLSGGDRSRPSRSRSRRCRSSPSPPQPARGAEVTRNAVLASPEHQMKVSLRSPLMLPRLALIDPELTFALPPAATAATGWTRCRS